MNTHQGLEHRRAGRTPCIVLAACRPEALSVSRAKGRYRPRMRWPDGIRGKGPHSRNSLFHTEGAPACASECYQHRDRGVRQFGLLCASVHSSWAPWDPLERQALRCCRVRQTGHARVSRSYSAC